MNEFIFERHWSLGACYCERQQRQTSERNNKLLCYVLFISNFNLNSSSVFNCQVMVWILDVKNVNDEVCSTKWDLVRYQRSLDEFFLRLNRKQTGRNAKRFWVTESYLHRAMFTFIFSVVVAWHLRQPIPSSHLWKLRRSWDASARRENKQWRTMTALPSTNISNIKFMSTSWYFF